MRERENGEQAKPEPRMHFLPIFCAKKHRQEIFSYGRRKRILNDMVGSVDQKIRLTPFLVTIALFIYLVQTKQKQLSSK